MSEINPREVTLKIIYDILKKGIYSNIALNKYISDKNIKILDKKLITEISYGTLRKLITIDYVIGIYSKVKLKKISPWILNIVRMGIYQILFCDKIPDFAVCKESTGLAQRYGHRGSVGYVNGILRNIVRNKDEIEYPREDNDKIMYLSVVYSIPYWIVKRFVDNYDYEFTKKMFIYISDNETKFSVRVNTLKNKLNDLHEILKNDNIITRSSDLVKDALIIENPNSVTQEKSYKNGLFHIQGESSMLVTEILNPKKDEFVIDVCSAPGGKTTHIAEKMDNKGKIIAMDISASRLKSVNENAKRLGIDIINTVKNDGTELNEEYINTADRVLVDVVCSGFGVINKRPDILINRKKEDIEKLVQIQEKILKNSSNYVKPKGILVYSTCTLEPMENEKQVERFLEKNNNFKLDCIKKYLPDNLKDYAVDKGYIRIIPHINKLDGFFIARFIRKE